MIDIVMALGRLALAPTQSDLDLARLDAADLLDQARWPKSARTVVDSSDRTRRFSPSMRPVTR